MSCDKFSEVPLPDERRAAVLANTSYRRVLYTHFGDARGDGAFQEVAMALGYGDPAPSLGWEVHPDTAQYFAVEEGSATVIIGTSKDDPAPRRQAVSAAKHSKWDVPPGAWHDVAVADGERVKLFTRYNPPHHPPGTHDETRADAEAREAASSTMRCVVCGKIALMESRATGQAVCGRPHLLALAQKL